MKRYIYLILFLGLLISCSEEENAPKKADDDDDTETPVDSSDWVIETITEENPITGIEWGEPRKISHDIYNAAYPRMIRLGGDTLLLAYHGGPLNNTWDNIYYRKSYDLGETWSEVETLMADNDENYWGFANPEFLELRSGRILMAFTGRGKPDDNEHDNIQLMYSDDRGVTWSDPSIVSYGRAWEPAMIQHPDGEILMFFSSEAQWWGVVDDDEVPQEILMMISDDEGLSWTNKQSVAYTSGKRDGMPVPVVLREGKGLAFAIESVESSHAPYILKSSLSNKFEDDTQVSRYLAASVNLVDFGGAPYLIQLSSGETILSCHDTGGRTIGSDWMKNTMYVLIGDEEAENFENVSYPFPDLPANEGAYFNSICALDSHTIIALASRNFSDDHSEVYWVTGTVVREE